MHTLTQDLLKAADVLLHHGEFIEVVFVKPSGGQVKCNLVGHGEDRDANTVVLRTWYTERLFEREFPLEAVSLPDGVYNRLCCIAQEQRGGRKCGDVRQAPQSLAEFLARQAARKQGERRTA